MRALADWLALQQRVHARSIDLGLERVGRVARSLDLDRPPSPVITVGGTNGKGSTVAFLESLGMASGLRVGAFTSPHLLRYTERIRVDGEEAAEAEIVRAFEAIEAARGDTTLTYFEYNALAALHVFRERAVTLRVLEVGLGGRLDAVNLIDADVAVLCSVGDDHRDWLGDTLDAIGREKAGIFRARRPAVLGTADLPATVFAEIARVGAEGRIAGRDFHWTRDGDRWQWQGRTRRFDDLPRPALAGDIQYANAATALAAYEASGLPLARDAVERALREVRLRGRLEVVPGDIEWILDVAHNGPAATVLAAHLAARPSTGRAIAVCGFLDDKDIGAIGRALAPVIDDWIVMTLPPPRGVAAAEAARRLALDVPPRALCETVAEACAQARALARPGDRIVAFGSFLVVGPAMEWLRL